jgi:hypothetical protein
MLNRPSSFRSPDISSSSRSVLYCSFIHFFYSCCSTCSIRHPWNASFHFSFLIFRQSVGLLGGGISLSQGRYLHRTTQTQNKRRQTSMPRMGFESAIPAFERAKTVHALDRAATVIGIASLGSLLSSVPSMWIFHRLLSQYPLLCSSYTKSFSNSSIGLLTYILQQASEIPFSCSQTRCPSLMLVFFFIWTMRL